MRYRHLSLSLAAFASGTILAPEAAGGVRWDSIAPDLELTGCAVTMQPWLGDYHLSFEYAGGTVERVHTATQEGGIPGEHNRWVVAPETFTVKVGELDAVLWTSTNYRLPVDDDSCSWADGFVYDAAWVDGKRMVDSVVIAPIWVPVPPTTAAPPTTSSAPEQTTTTAPFTEQTTPVPTPPVDVFVTTPAPPSSESTTSLPVVELREELPFTGSDSAATARLAAAVATVGALFLALSRKLARR